MFSTATNSQFFEGSTADKIVFSKRKTLNNKILLDLKTAFAIHLTFPKLQPVIL